MPKKKVFVRPRPKGKKRTEEDRDALIAKKAERAICQVAKKLKAFEAQHITRNMKQHRQKFENLDEKSKTDETKRLKFEQIQEKYTDELNRAKSFDVKKYLVPIAFNKLGLGQEFDWKKDNKMKNNDKMTPKKKETKELKEDNEENSSAEESNDDDDENEEGEFEEIRKRVESDDEQSSDDNSDHDDNDDDDVVKETIQGFEVNIESQDHVLCQKLAERMLQHQSMSKVLESLNDDVTQRRREKLAIFEGRPLNSKNMKKAKKKNISFETDDGLYSYSVAPEVNHRSGRTTFLTSLSGAGPDDADDFRNNSDDDSDSHVTHQKNRPGQRARQARVQIELARQEKKERKKRLKQAGIIIDPNYKEEHKKKWAEQQKKVLKESRIQSTENTKRRLRNDDEIDEKNRSNKKTKHSSKEEIHSSWEAAKLRKEKEKELLNKPFQGKKKLFRDDDEDGLILTSSEPVSSSITFPSKFKNHVTNQVVQLKNKSPSSSSTVIQAESVHPSWAAKQAQVAKLASGFQGKKIRFNDDE